MGAAQCIKLWYIVGTLDCSTLRSSSYAKLQQEYSSIVTLLCHRSAMHLPLRTADFAGGKAHKGISRSALSVWATVKEQVEALLREHKDYQLVLTGACLPYMA